MKAYEWSTVINPRILNIGATWGKGIRLTPQTLYYRKITKYPLNSRLGGSQILITVIVFKIAIIFP